MRKRDKIMKPKKLCYETMGLYLSYLLKICIFSLIIISIHQRQWVYFFGSTLALILSLVPTLFKRNYQITLPLALELLITISLLFHIGGEILQGYQNIPHYDTIAHFVSGFTIAFLSFVIIYILHVFWDGLIMNRNAMALLVVFCTMAMGVVWEFTEWISDLVFSTNTQWSYLDTIKDLAMDTLAGIVMAVIGVNMIEKGSFDEMTESLGEQVNQKIIMKMQKKKSNEVEDQKK